MKSCIVSVLGKKYSICSYKSHSDIPISSSDISILPHPDLDFEVISSEIVVGSPLGALRAIGEYVFHSLGYPRTELEILAFGKVYKIAYSQHGISVTLPECKQLFEKIQKEIVGVYIPLISVTAECKASFFEVKNLVHFDNSQFYSLFLDDKSRGIGFVSAFYMRGDDVRLYPLNEYPNSPEISVLLFRALCHYGVISHDKLNISIEGKGKAFVERDRSGDITFTASAELS